MDKIILIDGNSLMYRAFYATYYQNNVMKTKDGLHTNALYGFVNMISKLISGYSYCFVSFDAGKKTFRHKLYSEYKKTRKQAPVELYEQIPLIKEYLDILNIKRFETFDYEADDLIATIATKFYNEFSEINIITADKDLLQLVNEKVSVFLTKKGVLDLDEYNNSNFFEKAKITPEQIPFYKGLIGDTSDNLIGVKGIGEVGGIKLINEYLTLDNLYLNLDKLSKKQKELFIEQKESAYNCFSLAKLIKDVPLEINKLDLEIKEYNYNSLVNFYTKVEFNSFLKNLKKTKEIVNDNLISLESEFSLIKDSLSIVCELKSKDYLNYKEDIFLGVGIYSNNKYFFIKKEEIINIKNILEDESILKYTYDYKCLNYILSKENIDLKGVIFDLLLDCYLINPNYVNTDFKITVENFIQTNLDYNNPNYEYTKYSTNACLKAYTVNSLYPFIKNKIKENEQEKLSLIELNLSKTLSQMELDGLYIDLDELEKVKVEFLNKLNDLETKIYNYTGFVFNLNSPKQLAEVLFEKLKLPYGKKNKTGYSTNNDVLEKLSKDYEIASLLIEYRSISKLISTYINGLKDVIDNNYIYPIYKQAFTNTGRLSSINPNIQAMPVRNKTSESIRKLFKSRFENGVIISCDYSQIELRLLAHFSNDPLMIKAFKNNEDIHTQTAQLIYEVESPSKSQRSAAKAINFGIIYGMSAWGLSEQLNISQTEACLFIEKYFEKYQLAKKKLDEFVEFTKETGYSKTLYNRIRYINEINNPSKSLANFGERTAMNSPLQGSAADIMKESMNKVYQRLKNYKTKIIATIHDELLFDCPQDEVEVIKKIIKEEMEVELSIPLTVSISSGVNWFECK